MELALEGWLDTQAAPELAKAIEELGEETTELVLEMKGCEYISSSGVRQIVAAHKKMNGHMVIRNAGNDVLDVLKMTGVARKLTIE